MHRPWSQIHQLSSLLLDMTPSDLSAFVPAAKQTGFNPVALLLMAMAKQPMFVATLSDHISTRSISTPVGMADAIGLTLQSLESVKVYGNSVVSMYTQHLTHMMIDLGMLIVDDAKDGVILGGAPYALVTGVPPILQACFDTASSHHFPDVTTASQIPGYLESWVKFLDKLPEQMNLGEDAHDSAPMDVIGKLMVWLRSAFLDEAPTTVEDAADLWWPVSLCLTVVPNTYCGDACVPCSPNNEFLVMDTCCPVCARCFLRQSALHWFASYPHQP